ncbi:hypothetical protein Droror1_Dr00020070 [Drosera rotundifolia]
MRTDPRTVADFWSMTKAPRARPRPCATSTLRRREKRLQKKADAVGFSPVIQYTMVMNTVGSTSSMGRSPAIRAMKYDESLYIPDDLSFSSIIRSGGNVKMAWNNGKKPQNPE